MNHAPTLQDDPEDYLAWRERLIATIARRVQDEEAERDTEVVELDLEAT